MPGETLFGEATQALQGASNTATSANEIAQKDRSDSMRSGDAATGNLSSERQTQMSGEQRKQLATLQAQLDQAGNMMEITPQIALGLVKNTGDKEWLKGVGQKMRSDVVMAMYTHGIKLNEAKKAPKITQIYDENGKVRHAVVYTDEDGNPQQLMLDAGIKPEDLNRGKGGGKKGGSGSDESLKKMKEFNRAYEKARSETSDPSRAAQLKATNPEAFASKQQWLKDHQDQYDANIKALGKEGGAVIPGETPGGSPQPDNAPFDADAFIKDALGSK